jgi:hypothetical protein
MNRSVVSLSSMQNKQKLCRDSINKKEKGATTCGP